MWKWLSLLNRKNKDQQCTIQVESSVKAKQDITDLGEQTDVDNKSDSETFREYGGYGKPLPYRNWTSSRYHIQKYF